MLQQTQVKTVLPYFDRWMRELPDFATLAAAPESRVIKLWEGLGYYNRARNLHRLSILLAAMPKAPATAAEWVELPGIGPYTAAAIASIACGEAAACVDGNIVRVLGRLTATGTSFKDNGTAVKHFAPLATALLDHRHPGDHNEALMELGATVCTKAAPACGQCPVARLCEGLRSGDPASLPRIARRATETREVIRAWCVDRGRLLLQRVGSGAKRLAGQHELPEVGIAGIPAQSTKGAPILAKRTRSITHHRITETIVRVVTKDLKLSGSLGELVWVPVGRLEQVTLSGPHRRWVTELLAAE